MIFIIFILKSVIFCNNERDNFALCRWIHSIITFLVITENDFGKKTKLFLPFSFFFLLKMQN
jgi:hypothetical protein